MKKIFSKIIKRFFSKFRRSCKWFKRMWDNYDYETSIYLQDAIKESIDMVLDYSLYYHRDITDDSQPIVSADDNYRYITDKLAFYFITLFIIFATNGVCRVFCFYNTSKLIYNILSISIFYQITF